MGGLIAEGWLSTNHFVDQNAWGAGFPAEVDILWFFTTAFIHPSWFPIWGLWVEVLLKYYGRGEGKMGWKWVEATKKVEDWYMCIYIYNILANALPRKLWKSNDRWFEEWLNFAQKNRWWCFALDLMLVWFPAPYKSFLEVSIYLISKVRHESLLKSSVAQEENDSFGNKKTCHWVNVDEQRSVFCARSRGNSTSKTQDLRPTKCLTEVTFFSLPEVLMEKIHIFCLRRSLGGICLPPNHDLLDFQSHQVVTSLEESLHSTIRPSINFTPLSNYQTENTKYLEVKICRTNQGTQGPPINRLAMSLKSGMALCRKTRVLAFALYWGVVIYCWLLLGGVLKLVKTGRLFIICGFAFCAPLSFEEKLDAFSLFRWKSWCILMEQLTFLKQLLAGK